MDESTYGEYIRSKLKDYDLEIFDLTPNINARRADEIRAFIQDNFKNPSKCKFVIVDDEQIYDYSDHQIRTSYENGLTEDHILIAKELVNHLF